MWILIVLLVMLLVFAFLGFESANRALYPRMKTDEHFKNIWDKYKQYDKDWYDELDKEEFYIKSRYGYDIHLIYVGNPVPTRHTVVICHGVTTRSESVIKFLKMFLDNGYNGLLIDHRAHGKTGGSKVSFGYYEKYDLAEAIKWARERNDGKIGLIGESMGAGISMQTLLVEKVDFVIADCGYTSFGEELKHQLGREKGVPVYPTYYFSRLFVYLLGGYDIEKASPMEAISQVDTPVMIVHGELDDYVPAFMSSMLYDNIKSENKKLYIAEGTKHARSYEEHPQEYQRQVRKFLQSIDMPHAEKFST